MLSQPCEESKNHVKQLQPYLPRNILEFHEIWTSVWNWSIVASWEEGITQLKIVSSFWIESSLVHGGSSYAVNSYWSMADVADTSAGEKLHCCAFKYMVILSWPLHQNPKKVYLCFVPNKPFLTHFISPHRAAARFMSPFHKDSSVWGWTVTSSQPLSVTLTLFDLGSCLWWARGNEAREKALLDEEVTSAWS